MHRTQVLIIDQGGHASRATVIDQHGNIHASAAVAIRPHSNADGHIEYAPKAMLKSMHKAIQMALKTAGKQPILSAAMATQRSNIICWNRHSGQPLSPIMSWQDRRAHIWLKTKQAHSAYVHQQTGLFLSAHYGASKLNWCLNNIAAVQQAERQEQLAWGPMASWLTLQLCQEKPFVCDAVNASRTLLWSLQQQQWSTELLTLFELPARSAAGLKLLPESVHNFFNYGHLSYHHQLIPLQLVTGDQAAALYAFGNPRSDTAYITVGTGAFVLNPCGQQPVIDDQLLCSIIHADQQQSHYALEGTVNGAGCALDYYAQQFNRPDYIEQLPHWMARISDPPLFLNGYSGLGTPYMQAHFPSQFIDTETSHARAENRLVAVIESIIFLLQCNIEAMKQLNPNLQHIIIGGGIAQFDGFCQRLADFGLPVIRPQQTETTQQGLATLLFQHLDIPFQPTHCHSKTFSPQPNPALLKRYKDWQQAMNTARNDAH